MIVPKEILTQHIAILGKTRSGKSSVMRGLVESLLKRQEPVCIVDPKGDWWGIKLAADGKGPGYPVVIFGGEHGDVPLTEHAGAHVAELFATGNRSMLIDLGGWTVGARTRFWIDFASTLFKHTKGQRWLAVDEIHNFAPKGKVFDAEAGKALHWTNRLASEGLGKGVSMVFASQRPQKVHNDTLTSAETLIAMRVLHPSDRGAVADWIKGCGDSEGSEVLNSLAQMERGEGWVWSPEIGFGPKRVKFPLFTTYDSFRPQTIEDAKRLKGWAEVDLDEVRAKLAATIEKAKADDPRELRKQIAELKQQLAKAATQVPATTEPIRQVEPVETFVLKDGQLERAEKLVEQAVAAIMRYHDLLKGTVEAAELKTDKPLTELRATVDTITAAIEKTRQPVVKTRADYSKIIPGEAARAFGERFERAGRLVSNPPKQPPSVRPINGDGPKIERAAERKVLTALAMYPNGRTVRQVAILAVYAMGGGGFRNALGRLKGEGLIEAPSPGFLRITDLGLSVLGPFEPLPLGRALADYWLRQLDRKAEREVLQVLLNAFPKSLTADQIAAQTETQYEPDGGGFRNAIGKLRTLELIEGRGEIRASEDLFDA